MLQLKQWVSAAVATFKKIGEDIKALKTELAKKVDKETGKGLSEQNFTKAEKDKLAGLSLKYMGNYVSLAALKTAKPEGETPSAAWNKEKTAGFYADVDEGKGKEVVRYIWDSNDFKWVKQIGASSQLTSSEVKTLYESNSNTNAYTDAEKAIVTNIKAQVDAKADKIRKINTGIGLSGGGDLSADRTLSVNFATSAEITAGTSTDKSINAKELTAALNDAVGTSNPLDIYNNALAGK